jgi:hypothetical protein
VALFRIQSKHQEQQGAKVGLQGTPPSNVAGPHYNHLIACVLFLARYSSNCRQLIAQFKTATSLLGDIVPDLENFVKDYNLNCPAAVKRLEIGVPATVEHGNSNVPNEANGHKTAKYVAEAVQVSSFN